MVAGLLLKSDDEILEAFVLLRNLPITALQARVWELTLPTTTFPLQPGSPVVRILKGKLCIIGGKPGSCGTGDGHGVDIKLGTYQGSGFRVLGQHPDFFGML